MSEIVITLADAMAAATIFGLFVGVPLMKIEQNISELVGIVKNCPYCMRRQEIKEHEEHRQ